MAELTSKRAEIARDTEDFLNKYMDICLSNSFDERKNPAGYINLGTAVNNMCNDLIYPKITSDKVWFCDTNLLQYKEGYGIMRLRKAFATILTDFFEAYEPVIPENVFCVSGVTSCIDILAHCLADPGDVFLVPTPVYGCIYTDFKVKALVDIWPIPIITPDNVENFPVLTLEKVINAYESAVAKGKTVRGIFLINPSNPLGDIYSSKLLMDILLFCRDHSLHVVVDEIYALSVFSGAEKFHSVLKFPKLPDPERTHVIYGLSKDFGMAGLRIGVVHTTCKLLQKCLIQLSFFQNIPFPVMDITARYLEDTDWLKEYLAVNEKRLGETFNFCVNFLKKMGLEVRTSSAGFFLWINFRHICPTFEAEMEFFEYLFTKVHLYIGPGKEFLCAQPGWFRIVFTHDRDHLIEGLNRLEKAVKEYQSCST